MANSAGNPLTMETLIEQQRLYDLIVRCWCVGVDTLDWKLYRSVLADEIEMHFPDPSDAGKAAPKRWLADDWVQVARGAEGFDATQHCVSNFIFDFDGNSAAVTSYLVASHQLGGAVFTLGGQSVHGFERTAEGWKIVKVAVRPWWMTGDPTLMGKAGERFLSKQAPRSAIARC